MRRSYCILKYACVATVMIVCTTPLRAQLLREGPSDTEVPMSVGEDQFSLDTDLPPPSIDAPVGIADVSATRQVSDELRDLAFERYLDLSVLDEAWNRLDPALMTDVALRLAEGERVLLRCQKAIKSDELLKLAAKIAVDKRDQPTLERLQKYFDQHGKSDMSASLAASRKLTGESRAVDPGLLVSVDEMTPEAFTQFHGLIGEIRAARYIGNPDQLDRLDQVIDELPWLTEKQKAYLRSITRQGRADTESAQPDATAQLLERLTASSRSDTTPSFLSTEDGREFRTGATQQDEQQQVEESSPHADEIRRQRDERINQLTEPIVSYPSQPSNPGGGPNRRPANPRPPNRSDRARQEQAIRDRQRQDQARQEQQRRDEQSRREENVFLDRSLPSLPNSIGLGVPSGPPRGGSISNGEVPSRPIRIAQSGGQDLPTISMGMDWGGVTRVMRQLQSLGSVKGDIDKGTQARRLIGELQLQMQLAEQKLETVIQVRKEAEILRRENGRLTPEQQSHLNRMERMRIELLIEKQKAIPVLQYYLREIGL